MRPPVVAVVSLQTRFTRIILIRSEITIWALAGKRPFDKRLCLGDELLVMEDISQRQQTVQPIRPTLPLIAIPAAPAVANPHHLRIKTVEMPGGALRLSDQHLPQPTLWSDGAQR